MLSDNMEDQITVEEILLHQAQEIARQSSRANSADADLAPWGGKFSKDVPQQVHAAQKSGNA